MQKYQPSWRRPTWTGALIRRFELIATIDDDNDCGDCDNNDYDDSDYEWSGDYNNNDYDDDDDDDDDCGLKGEFTLFAPTDLAFNEFLQKLGGVKVVTFHLWKEIHAFVCSIGIIIDYVLFNKKKPRECVIQLITLTTYFGDKSR